MVVIGMIISIRALIDFAFVIARSRIITLIIWSIVLRVIRPSIRVKNSLLIIRFKEAFSIPLSFTLKYTTELSR